MDTRSLNSKRFVITTECCVNFILDITKRPDVDVTKRNPVPYKVKLRYMNGLPRLSEPITMLEMRKPRFKN